MNFSEAVNPTFRENLDVLLMLLVGTTPLDIGLICLAYRNQKRKLSPFTYMAVLTVVNVIGLLTVATAFNFVSAPSWYDRMPAAKLMVFLLIGMLFGLQSICWYLGDWFRIEKRGKTYNGKWAKRAILFISLTLFSLAALGNRSSTSQTKLVGPENSILLDGQDDCVIVESASYIDGEQFTLEAWLNFRGSHDGAVMSYSPIVLKLMPSGKQAVVRVVVILEDQTMLLIDSKTTIPLNQWAHLAVTYNGNQLNLFVNGESVDTEVRTLGLEDEMAEAPMPDYIELKAVYGVSPVHIGIRNQNSRKTAFNGRIGEVRVSSYARYRDRFTPRNNLVHDPQTKFYLKLDDSEDGLAPGDPLPFRTELRR